MINDYNILKKKYGERFARLCRELFPTILDESGLLTDIITSNFAKNNFLYDDIVQHDLVHRFKEFILSENQKLSEDIDYKPKVIESPFELMKEAGYSLYKCDTDADVKSFKKYWKKEEELCTFRDADRINTNLIFFAVKDNVDKIKRKDFTNPKRQDKYGTSVISLQFTKRKPSMLSIKNRYNHTVPSCDATFSNDPENIIAGLTDAFINEYNLDFTIQSRGFEIPSYVLVNDGKYYKYNIEVNNEYFCDNKIINHNRDIEKIDGSRYILIDNYVVDTKFKKVLNYDLYNQIKDKEDLDLNKLSDYRLEHRDAFIDSIGEISNIEVTKSKEGRTITITPNEGENLIIDIDKNNAITGYTNANVKKITGFFLHRNKKLKFLNMPNVTEVGYNFLYSNECAEEVILSSVKKAGFGFLRLNKKLKILKMLSLEEAGDSFLYNNEELEELILPNLKKLSNFSLYSNKKIKKLDLSALQDMGSGVLNSYKYRDDIINKIMQRKESEKTL